jgi:hypothetical protein
LAVQTVSTTKIIPLLRAEMTEAYPSRLIKGSRRWAVAPSGRNSPDELDGSDLLDCLMAGVDNLLCPFSAFALIGV